MSDEISNKIDQRKINEMFEKPAIQATGDSDWFKRFMKESLIKNNARDIDIKK